MDADGHPHADPAAPAAGFLDPDAIAALAKAWETRQSILSEVHADARHSFPHLSLVTPLFQGHVPAGAVILIVDARESLFPLIQSWPVPSATAESLMVRRDGDDVLFLNELRYRQGASLAMRMPLTRTELPAVQAVMGRTGLIDGLDYRGVPVVSAAFPVPGSPWLLVAKEDAEEIYGPVRREARLLAAWLLVGLGLFGALVALFVQRRELIQEQKRLAAEVERGLFLTRFQTLFDHSLDGILLLSVDHRVLDANPAAHKIFGYGRGEIRNLGLRELLQETEQARLTDAVPEVMAGTPHHQEWRLRRRDGSTFLAEVAAQALDSTSYFATVRDISERRAAEEALANSKARYDTLVRRIPVGLFTLCQHGDGSWHFLYLSEKLCALTGLDEAAVLRDPELANAPFLPEDRERLEAATRHAFATGQPFCFEGRFQVRAETRWMRIESEATPPGRWQHGLEWRARRHHRAETDRAIAPVDAILDRARGRCPVLGPRGCEFSVCQ